jgi:hypothetical protein
MIPHNPVAEFLAWLLFALLLIWALWQGLPDFAQRLKHNSAGSEDIHFFPDEVGSKPGSGTLAGSGGDMDPRDARSRHHGDFSAVSQALPAPQPGGDHEVKLPVVMLEEDPRSDCELGG